MMRKQRILVAPLNWGLGHASRCIPIIHNLINKNYEVIIAAEGRSLNLMKDEFPNLKYIILNNWNIKYHDYLPASLMILLQIPKIIYSIYTEHKLLKKVIKQYQINIVIADNRYGLFSKKIKTVFITHQVMIMSPFFKKIIQKISYILINKFNECWIIDDQKINLAGQMSKPTLLPKKYKYIGIQSRFTFRKNERKKYDICAIISGPEPQRSILEKIITRQLKTYTGNSIIIQGKTEITSKNHINNITILSNANSKEINQIILSSKLVISRSGYSSIMDLYKLKARSILIPTPGQYEQEYLSNLFHSKKIFLKEEQTNFNLINALKKYNEFPRFKFKKSQDNWSETFKIFQE